MPRTIRMRLDESSIMDAIEQIEEYKRLLVGKTREFVDRLVQIGIQVVDANMNTAGDSSPEHTNIVRIGMNGDTVKATLTVQGHDLLFIEFGAGIHYNGEAGTSPNPKGVEMGYVIGSYGHGQGQNDYWHYRDRASGRWRTSHGTQASMPMYKADMEIQQRFIAIAQEVFGG